MGLALLWDHAHPGWKINSLINKMQYHQHKPYKISGVQPCIVPHSNGSDCIHITNIDIGALVDMSRC